MLLRINKAFLCHILWMLVTRIGHDTLLAEVVGHGTHHCMSVSGSLLWRHNGHDGISHHQPYDCLLNHLFRHRPKKTSKLPITGLCAGNSPVTGEFPTQRASNAENVSIWWHHHVFCGNLLLYQWCPKTNHDSHQHMSGQFLFYHKYEAIDW